MPFTETREDGLLITRARQYNLVVNVIFGGRRARLDRVLVKASGAAPGDRVLDVGCGPGRFARRLAAAVGAHGEVLGVDPSEPMIDHAREHARSLPGCRFTVGSAQSLELPSATYDVVTSTFAMHHIAEDGRARALAEMYRVLRPGGRLLIADAYVSGRVAPKVVGAMTWLTRRRGHGHDHGDGHDHDNAAADSDVRRYQKAIGEAGFTGLEFTDVPPLTRYVTAVKPR